MRSEREKVVSVDRQQRSKEISVNLHKDKSAYPDCAF